MTRMLSVVPDASRAEATALRRWESEVDAYMTHLRSEGKSPHTLRSYRQSMNAWRRFCEATDRPLDPREITRRDAEAFPIWLEEGGASDSTQKTRQVALSTFFGWLASEGEEVITKSPFKGLRAPKVGKRDIPVIPADQLATLLLSVGGRSFEDRRDLAILMLMVSTGCRRSEVAALLVTDIDVSAGRVTFHGKGDKQRTGGFGDATSQALRHYLRARNDHDLADEEYPVGDRADTIRIGRPLWLATPGTGHRGALGAMGITHILERRCKAAHVPKFNPHRFRHTWANAMLVNGAADGDVMRLAGWDTRSMLDRYTAHGAMERALAHYQDPLDAMLKGGGRRGGRPVR